MRTLRVDSVLKYEDREFSFSYPETDPISGDAAVIRGPKESISRVGGKVFDEIPTYEIAFNATAHTFGFMKGDPVLAWLEGCFTCVRAHRVSMGIKRSIESGAASYKRMEKQLGNNELHPQPNRGRSKNKYRIVAPKGVFPKAKKEDPKPDAKK